MDKNINVSGTSDQRLEAFRSSTKDVYAILQLRYCDETDDERFVNYEDLSDKGKEPVFEHYDTVYVGESSAYTKRDLFLEELFRKFNLEHPEDFRGHSLSVSDVVLLNEGSIFSAHFVDSFGFTKLEGFLPPEVDHLPAYSAVCFNTRGELLEIELTDDPKEAIERWFRFEKRSPLFSCINIGSREAALKLVEAADDELLDQLYEKYKPVYKLSSIKEMVQKQRENGCRGYLGPGDMICPFDLG